jgi:ribonuclease J
MHKNHSPGALHEIGKNTCVFEYGDEIILLDAGLAFLTGRNVMANISPT